MQANIKSFFRNTIFKYKIQRRIKKKKWASNEIFHALMNAYIGFKLKTRITKLISFIKNIQKLVIWRN